MEDIRRTHRLQEVAPASPGHKESIPILLLQAPPVRVAGDAHGRGLSSSTCCLYIMTQMFKQFGRSCGRVKARQYLDHAKAAEAVQVVRAMTSCRTRENPTTYPGHVLVSGTFPFNEVSQQNDGHQPNHSWDHSAGP